MDINFDIELHDATLLAIELVWAEGRCVFKLRNHKCGDFTLTFGGVTAVSLPRIQPWGPSASINMGCRHEEGRYNIEMQSGDLLQVDARTVTFARIGEA